MHIMFVLSGISKKPIGGFKVVYEYANRLAEHGNEITILFMCGKTLKSYHLPERVRRLIVKGLASYYPRWFPLSGSVNKMAVFDWTNEEVPDADAIIAVPNTSAELVYHLSDKKGKKYYLIQGFENWSGTSEDWLYHTYHLGMTNIVVSKWLKEVVDAHSETESLYIPNGLDFRVFGIDRAIGERTDKSVAMLYHDNEIKGCRYGLEAIMILKEKYTDLKVRIFGIPKRPSALPDWIEYTRNASQEQLRNIYNQTAVFLCPTIYEGFGLTGAESMACGCALASTGYPGVLEYAVDHVNALLCPVKDAKALAKNVETLLLDQNLRIKIAKQGNQDIKRLSWDASVKEMSRVLSLNQQEREDT